MTPHLAHVYARVQGVEQTSGWTLAGQVQGPYTAASRTLPATSPLADLGPGDTLLARAKVPDPCFWSPRLPALYRVRVEVRHGGEVVEVFERSLGMRWLGPRGRNLIQQGKRWVLRGVHQPATRATDLADWVDAAAAMIVDNPDDALCRLASERGLLLVARLRGTPDELLDQLRRLAQWAAVAVVVVESDVPHQETLRRTAPNVLLAQPLSAAAPAEPAGWAHLVWWDAGADSDWPAAATRAARWNLAVIAQRRLEGQQELGAARAACDRLQRDLAPYGQFAGYVV